MGENANAGRSGKHHAGQRQPHAKHSAGRPENPEKLTCIRNPTARKQPPLFYSFAGIMVTGNRIKKPAQMNGQIIMLRRLFIIVGLCGAGCLPVSQGQPP